MAHPRYRAVLDTNVLLRGLVHSASPSGRILAACDRRLVVPVLSAPVMAEYRYVLADPDIVARYPQLEPRRVQISLARLRYIGDFLRAPKVRFRFPRDPKDAKFLELAIAAQATHLVTCDRDLLELPSGIDEAAQRFRRRLPMIQVLEPADFVCRAGLLPT